MASRLVALLNDSTITQVVKRTVIGLMAKHRSPEIEAALLIRAEDPAPCKYAVSALGNAGTPSIIPILQQYVDGEYDREVKLHAQEAISRIRTRVLIPKESNVVTNSVDSQSADMASVIANPETWSS